MSIYKNYYPRIYNYVYYRVNGHHDTDDLISTIFEKAFYATEKFNPQKASFSTWLFLSPEIL